MPINETFYGFIESTTDALLVFEACERGVLPKISRRLQEKERSIIRSGSIFVFDEKESGIKRWTDGHVWSPSRILGNFLIYRELDGRETLHQRKQFNKFNSPYYFSRSNDMERFDAIEEYDNFSHNVDREEKAKDRNLLGSLTDTYKFLQDGLIKKTISIHVNGRIQHLVSYYSKSDVLAGRLRMPSSTSALASLEISPDLILGQSFRVPPSIEFAESILKGPTLSPPSSTSTLSSNGSNRLPENAMLPSPQYSGYGEHPNNDYYQRLSVDQRKLPNESTKRSSEPNEIVMPPPSKVGPNYYHERERAVPKYYGVVSQNFGHCTYAPSSYTYNRGFSQNEDRQFPDSIIMPENNVCKMNSTDYGAPYDTKVTRPHLQIPKPDQSKYKYSLSLPSPSGSMRSTGTRHQQAFYGENQSKQNF